MSHEACFWIFCFEPVPVSVTDKIFAFSDFLTAVALLAVVYTITDPRYKFRITVAPGDLYFRTYALLAAVGVGSLLTALWPAMGWWVPETVGLSQTTMQALLAALFLAALFTWMWYAFIRPPVFGWRNARRFRDVLVSQIVRGNDDELKAIASELGRSATQLVKRSKQIAEFRAELQAGTKRKRPSTADYAFEIFQLIGNRRLCKQIVRTSPATAKLLFDAVFAAEKFGVPMAQFARNISSEAITWESSFLYDEAEGYDSGLLGYWKPISKAVYGNMRLIEALSRQSGSPFEVFYKNRNGWTAHQWDAFCRAALIAVQDAVTRGWANEFDSVFAGIVETLKDAYRDVGRIDGEEDGYDNDAHQRLRTVVRFVTQAITILDGSATPRPDPLLRVREGTYPKNIYDHLAGLVVDLCFAASRVTGPPMTSWMVQYNGVWDDIFGTEDGPVWRVVRHKVMRLLYDEIAHMSKSPNYKGARILGFCLNVLGVSHGTRPKRGEYGRVGWPLAVAAQAWCKKHYLALRADLPDVADAVVLGSLSCDEANKRLVKTYTKGLRKEAPQRYLALDDPPAPAAPAMPAPAGGGST